MAESRQRRKATEFVVLDLPPAPRTPGNGARIVSISNQKGGVAKTTTAINLSAHLAVNGMRVLLVDLDAQGNCATGLGIDKSNIEKGAHTCLLEPEQSSACIHATTLEKLHIIVSDQRLVDIEHRLHGMMGREKRLARALAPLRAQYDLILLDTPPSLGVATLNALTAAHGILIPVQTEFFSLEGLAILSRTIEEVRRRLNPILGVDAILLTMHAPTRLNAEVAEEIRSTLGAHVIEPPIRRNIRIAEAAAEGLPIHIHAPDSYGGEDYAKLGVNLTLRWGISRSR